MKTFQKVNRIAVLFVAGMSLMLASGLVSGCSKAEEEPTVTAPTDNNSEAARKADGAPPVTNAPPPGKWPGGG